MTSLQVGILASVVTAALWTISTCAWSSAGRHITALAISSVRLWITCAFLIAYGWLVRGLPFPSDAPPRAWFYLGVSGFIGFFVGDLCYFKAILTLGPRLTLLLQAFAPPITAIISWLFLGEPLGAKEWLAMVITLAGVVWVVLERSEPERQANYPRSGHRGLGITLGVLAATGQALGLILSRQGIGTYDSVAATFIRVIGGLVGFSVLLTVLGKWREMGRAAVHPQALPILIGGSLLGPFLGVIACMIAVRNCNAAVAAIIINTMPIMVLPIMIFVYGERVSLRAAGGAVVSVLGVALLYL